MGYGWSAVAAVVVALAAVNVVNNRMLDSAYLLVHVLEIALLVGFAAVAGLAPGELGLGRGTWARGLRWAGLAVALVAVGYAIALAVPAFRPALLDDRARFAVDVAVVRGAIPVLVNTVILEELAFRGVLWGLLRRVGGTTVATLVSSALFGLWHVLPALGLPGRSPAAGEVFGVGPGATLSAVAFGIASTFVAGVVLCELRRRSGSLLAPLGLHWATNGLGYVVGAMAWHL
ncbi:MAG TPA: CPBP family intramembrane glutamic endopeptidase [Micromonosporaceae bacterium]